MADPFDLLVQQQLQNRQPQNMTSMPQFGQPVQLSQDGQDTNYVTQLQNSDQYAQPSASSSVMRMAAASPSYKPTSGSQMEADSRSSIDDLMGKLAAQRDAYRQQDKNQQWMSFFSKLASSKSNTLLGGVGEGAQALSDVTAKQSANNQLLDQAELQDRVKYQEWKQDQHRQQQLADQTGTYQQGELGLKRKELEQNAANQLAERQKPIPDGYGGFIVPNPKDPTNPLRISGPLDSSGGSSLMNAYNKAPIDASGNTVTGDAFLSTLPPTVADLTKRIGDSKMQVTPYMMGMKADPLTKAAIAAVTKYNPDWDQSTYANVNKFNFDPNGGVKAKSLDTVVPHLQMLSDLTDSMKTGDVTTINAIKNKLATDFGVTFDNGLSDAANLKAAQQLVGNEIINSTIAQGKASGALGDREEIAKNLNNASNPEILKSNIEKVYKPAMRAQANSLEQYYKASTKQNNFKDRYLLPETRQAIWGDVTPRQPSAASMPTQKTIHFNDLPE